MSKADVYSIVLGKLVKQLVSYNMWLRLIYLHQPRNYCLIIEYWTLKIIHQAKDLYSSVCCPESSRFGHFGTGMNLVYVWRFNNVWFQWIKYFFVVINHQINFWKKYSVFTYLCNFIFFIFKHFLDSIKSYRSQKFPIQTTEVLYVLFSIHGLNHTEPV